MACPSDIDLLLIGKTGNGKSATGNSILGYKAFQSKSSCNSVTTDIQDDVALFNGKVIKVVDGPGVGDTRLSNKESLETITHSMEIAISCNPRGYHAFLLVIRFGGRFTKEDEDVICFLKKIFGDDFVRKFCILVMTCGDSFENEAEEDGITFKQWCNEQSGVFKSLLRECDYRIILFNNHTKIEQKKYEQRERLISMVEHLGSQNHRYTDINFDLARHTRQRMMVEQNEPVIREETLVETRLILQQLQGLQRRDPEMIVEGLQILYERTQSLLDKLLHEDQGTGALHKLTITVSSTLRTVEEERKVSERMIQEKRRMEAQIKENERRTEEKLTRQLERYERQLREKIIAEDEHLQLRRELDEMRQKEQKSRELQHEELLLKQKQELEMQQQRYDELDKAFKRVKKNNESGILSKVVKAVSFPFRRVANWIRCW